MMYYRRVAHSSLALLIIKGKIVPLNLDINMNISSLLNANSVPELNFTFIPYVPIDTPSTFYPPPAIVPQPPLVLHQPYLPNSLPLSEALPTVASLPSRASPSLTVSSPSPSTQPIVQS